MSRPTNLQRARPVIAKLYVADFDVLKRAQQTEYLQQVNHHRDHDDGVQESRNLGIHRDIGVDEPQQHADDNQEAYNIKQGHKSPLQFGTSNQRVDAGNGCRSTRCGPRGLGVCRFTKNRLCATPLS
jgi:hypothetical protein